MIDVRRQTPPRPFPLCLQGSPSSPRLVLSRRLPRDHRWLCLSGAATTEVQLRIRIPTLISDRSSCSGVLPAGRTCSTWGGSSQPSRLTTTTTVVVDRPASPPATMSSSATSTADTSDADRKLTESPTNLSQAQRDFEIIPETHNNRALVLCFDGTGDKFDSDVRKPSLHLSPPSPPHHGRTPTSCSSYHSSRRTTNANRWSTTRHVYRIARMARH